MPTIQRAVVVTEFGGPERLTVVEDWPFPKRQSGEVLIRLTSAGVNVIDTVIRSGAFPAKKLPKVLGGDAAGIVEEADEGSAFKVGDAVYAMTPWAMDDTEQGTYLQYASIPERYVAYVPPSLPMDEAAAVPTAALTAWQALEPLPLEATGRRVLISAAAGGVGHLAVQLAKSRGAYVVGTASKSNHSFLKDLGVDEALDYHDADVRALFLDNPFDVVIDMIGGAGSMAAFADVVKRGGVYVHVMNPKTDHAKLRDIIAAQRERTVRTHTVFVRPDGFAFCQITKLIQEGKVTVDVAAKIPLHKAAHAHSLLEVGHGRGKLVLTM